MPRLRLLPEVTLVDNSQTAAEVLNYLMRRGGPIAIDTETNGLDMMRSRVLCWSMATEDRRYYIAVEYLLFFDPLFRRTDIVWYLTNAKFDAHMLANMGVHLAGELHDIIVMDALDDDTRPHGLKEQSKIAYDVRWGDFKDLFLDPNYVASMLGVDVAGFTKFRKLGVGDKLLYVLDEKPEIVHNYASCDAFFTYVRAEDLRKQLVASPTATTMVDGLNTLYDYFRIIEVPFTKVLWKMERTGMPVNLDRVRKLDGPMRDGIAEKRAIIQKLAGRDFNPRSNDELRDILFGKSGFKLTPVSFTKSAKGAQASTGEKDLKSMLARVKDRKAVEFIQAILAFRHLDKLHGTFIKKIGESLGPDERVHCKINQTGARTGRLSASNPNLMQIPIRNDEFGIRSIFCAPKGYLFLDCDYPQIQPRLAAIFANEEKLLEDIRSGWDIHSANASNMFGPRDPRVTYDHIEQARKAKDAKQPLSDDQKHVLRRRDQAKTVGLGVLFGEGAVLMANQLGIESSEAEELISGFFRTYPQLKKLIEDSMNEAHDNGYCYTMLGRIRRLHQINQTMNMRKVFAERRQSFNTLIQGSEVELMKLAMLQIDACPKWKALGGELAMTVHDELCSFAPKETAKECLALKKQYMGDPLNWGCIRLKLPIPIDPDGGFGDNWAEAH